MSAFHSIREKLQNGELKIKRRREGQIMYFSERSGERVMEDDSCAGYIMCDYCEALYGDFK
jgi:hypothetical protein